MARTCIQRVQALDDADLTHALASAPSEVSKQICLYAMMRQYRLMWDFMVTVIGEKYRSLDTSFSKTDVNAKKIIWRLFGLSAELVELCQ